jgi:hypothetical protein
MQFQVSSVANVTFSNLPINFIKTVQSQRAETQEHDTLNLAENSGLVITNPLVFSKFTSNFVPDTFNFVQICTFEIRNTNLLHDFTAHKIHFSSFLPEYKGHLISFHPVTTFFYNLNMRNMGFASSFTNTARTVKILLLQQDILQRSVEVKNFIEVTTVKPFLLRSSS